MNIHDLIMKVMTYKKKAKLDNSNLIPSVAGKTNWNKDKKMMRCISH